MSAVYLTVKGSMYHLDSDKHGWEIVYSTTGREFKDRQAAIDDGLVTYRSDDFNIATVVDGALVAFGWQHQDFSTDGANLPDVAAKLGLQVAS
ncbi:hypothetical protein [Actinoplanes sp. NPDC051494]|uniref:hypothetical protein n=1 Tax=Actinoplanes sp. NPDC051494 TaxID=3363907 RepID=UPI003787CA0A